MRILGYSPITLLKLAIFLVAVGYVSAFCSLAWRRQDIAFAPIRPAPTPAEAGFPEAEVISIRTEDGVTLEAWRAPGPAENPEILYLHGDGGNLGNVARRLRALNRAGFGILALDYRGFGNSGGEPSEEGTYRDAVAGYRALLGFGLRPNKIAIVGESLGAGVAINLASRAEVAAVVVDAAYETASDVVAGRYWMFPIRIIMPYQVRSDLLIDKVTAPLLFLHGENDEIVPIKYARSLFARANQPKQFVMIPKAGHMVLDEPGAVDIAREWLTRTVPPSAP